MAGSVPSIDELRARAGREGVTPTDADLERVHDFLAVFLPLLAPLRESLPAELAPAAVFDPEREA